jgi:hypothetical protein
MSDELLNEPLTSNTVKALDVDDDTDSPLDESGSPIGLFEGDQGTLAAEVRRVLTMLIRDPYVCAQTNPDDYEVIRRNRHKLTEALNNLGLDLSISTRYEVAYTKQAPCESVGPLILKRSQPLRRDATCLLVSIRARQHNDEANGEELWTVSREDLAGLLASGPYAGELDGTRMDKALDAALRQLQEAGYLQALPAARDRFRVMPILPAVFTLERARELLDALSKTDQPEEEHA